jgi:hypothetical protein
MFGWWKSREQRERERIAQRDENELRCLEEIAQQYWDEKFSVTYEYAMRCYREYKEDSYKRTQSLIIDLRLITVLNDIKKGNDRRNFLDLGLGWKLGLLKSPKGYALAPK